METLCRLSYRGETGYSVDMFGVTEQRRYTFSGKGDTDVGSEAGQVVLTALKANGQVVEVAITEDLFERVTAAMDDVQGRESRAFE
jgi:hypothetical protein